MGGKDKARGAARAARRLATTGGLWREHRRLLRAVVRIGEEAAQIQAADGTGRTKMLCIFRLDA
jgi:hypothetical protein